MFTLVAILTEFKFVSKLHVFSVQRLENRHLLSLSLIYGVLKNVDLFSVSGHVSQVGHQEKCLRLTTQLK